MDSYDLTYPETGSGNIRKASPEWKEVLAQAREIHENAEPDTLVLHIAFRLVNEQVQQQQVAWHKCQECGTPYRETSWGSDTMCSDECAEAYVQYFDSPSW